MDKTIASLDKLHELQVERERLQVRETARIDELLIDVAPEIDAIRDDYAPQFESIDAEIAALQKEIKNDALGFGWTVRGKFLMAVWSKPRVTWDSKGLFGYMVAHPEIEAFKMVGKPSVSIRKVK